VKRRWSLLRDTGRSREVLTPERKAPPKRGQVCQGTLMRLDKASRCRPYRDRLLLSPRDKKPRRRQRSSLSLTGSAPIMTRVSRSTRSRSASITISMQPARVSSSSQSSLGLNRVSAAPPRRLGLPPKLKALSRGQRHAAYQLLCPARPVHSDEIRGCCYSLFGPSPELSPSGSSCGYQHREISR
jgi:hypothetical protein